MGDSKIFLKDVVGGLGVDEVTPEMAEKMGVGKLRPREVQKWYSLSRVRELREDEKETLLETMVVEDDGVYTEIITTMIEGFSSAESGRQEIDLAKYEELFDTADVQHVVDQLIELGLVVYIERDGKVSCGYVPSRVSGIERKLRKVFEEREKVLEKRLEYTDNELTGFEFEQDRFWSGKKSQKELSGIYDSFKAYHDLVSKMPILQLQQWVDLLRHFNQYDNKESTKDRERVLQEIRNIIDNKDILKLIRAFSRPRGVPGHSIRDQERVYELLENFYTKGEMPDELLEALQKASSEEKDAYDFETVNETYTKAEERQHSRSKDLAKITSQLHLLRRKKEALLHEMSFIAEHWSSKKNQMGQNKIAA